MCYLPLEIITNILSRLPVKSLVRFQCVSKEWHSLINGQDFIKLHLHRSFKSNTDRTLIVQEQNAGIPFDFFSVSFHDENRFGKRLEIYQPLHCSNTSTDILSSCNGLVCIYNQWGEVIAIWNPLIRKYRKLPREPIEKPSGFSNSWPISLAFGYDSHNDDYKVLRVVSFFNMGTPGTEFEVKLCSLRLQRWKKIEDQWPNKEWSIRSDSVFLNGALHWLVAVNGQNPENIVAFDLATEKFRVITTPLKAPTSCLTCLEVLEGQLCFIVIVDEMYNDVWLMKEYGEESSWTWIYKIEQGVVGSTFEYCKPLMCSKNNGKKILMEECHRYRTYLIWYDIEKKTRKRVKIHKLPAVFQSATCIGSLLLLDGDNVIDPTQKNNRNQSPSEGLNKRKQLLGHHLYGKEFVAEDKQGPVMILAFDLANEKFWDFATPRQPPTYGAERFLEACLEGFLEACLEVLNGKLCFIVNLDKKDNEVWLMEEYGEGSSWTRVYKIEYDGVFKNVKFFNPLMFSKNSKEILMEKCYWGRTFLIWFDTEIKKHRKVKIRKLPHVFQMAICTGSLLLLDGDNVISRY